jgi:hypothetical protein
MTIQTLPFWIPERGLLPFWILGALTPLACQSRNLNDDGEKFEEQQSILWEWDQASPSNEPEACSTSAEKAFPKFQAPFRVLRDPIEGHYFINECSTNSTCLSDTQSGPQFLPTGGDGDLSSTSILSWKAPEGTPTTCVYERSTLWISRRSGKLTLREDIEVYRQESPCQPDIFTTQSVEPTCKKSLERSARPAS